MWRAVGGTEDVGKKVGDEGDKEETVMSFGGSF
jgi:hypothetical protein